MDDGEIPLDRLEAEICELAGHIWAATCRWLVLLAEFDRREGWGAWGIQSCAHWLSWRCGVSLVAAREKVRVAHRLTELPLIRGAFSRGELSYSKVRALTRVARPETEAELLEAAQYATTSQLERIVRGYRFVLGQEEVRETNDRHDERFLRWHWDDDGSLVLSARLDPEDGAALIAALDAGRATMKPSAAEQPRDSAESLQATSADALATVAHAALPALQSDHEAPTSQVIVHVADDVLTGEAEDGRCHLDDGPSLAPESARRLACDASILAVLEGTDGTPLDVGRKTRSIPTGLRRALRLRDGGCRFPGCLNRRFVDGHHIQHWLHGGETKLTNVILLCRRHHRMIHEGGYGLESPSPHVFVFTDRHGRPIPEVPRVDQPTGPGLRDQHRHLGLAVGPDTCRSLGEGEPFDLGLTIDALLSTRDRRRREREQAASAA